jgi:hypothetical protein
LQQGRPVALAPPPPPRHPTAVAYIPLTPRYYFSLFTENLGLKKLGLKKLKNQNPYSPIPLIVIVAPVNEGQNQQQNADHENHALDDIIQRLHPCLGKCSR